jgi:hypothetical protein
MNFILFNHDKKYGTIEYFFDVFIPQEVCKTSVSDSLDRVDALCTKVDFNFSFNRKFKKLILEEFIFT